MNQSEDPTTSETVQAVTTGGIDRVDETVDPVAPAPDQNQIREIILRVPADVSDNLVDLAMKIGQSVLAGTQQGLAYLFFPTQNPSSREAMLGRAVIPLLSQKDVDRLIRLAQVIGDTNAEAVKRLQKEGPVAQLAVQRDADKAKGNATNDLVAQAQGRAGGIVIAAG